MGLTFDDSTVDNKEGNKFEKIGASEAKLTLASVATTAKQISPSFSFSYLRSGFSITACVLELPRMILLSIEGEDGFGEVSGVVKIRNGIKHNTKQTNKHRNKTTPFFLFIFRSSNSKLGVP